MTGSVLDGEDIVQDALRKEPSARYERGPVFHSSINRYFVITPIIALTSMKQLFSFAHVDG